MTNPSLLVAWVIGVALVPLSGGSADAQGTAEETWTVPRTADGQPDLEGVWTNATITPFERGNNFAYSGVAAPESEVDPIGWTADRRC